jgi:hypothetical protein
MDTNYLYFFTKISYFQLVLFLLNLQRFYAQKDEDYKPTFTLLNF